MKLNDLLEKFITIEYNHGEDSKVSGKLVEIDSDLRIIHIHPHAQLKGLLIPISSIKSIRETY